MTVEVYCYKGSPMVINFGSVVEPINDETLSALREANKEMRIERTSEGNVKMFPISRDRSSDSQK